MFPFVLPAAQAALGAKALGHDPRKVLMGTAQGALQTYTNAAKGLLNHLTDVQPGSARERLGMTGSYRPAGEMHGPAYGYTAPTGKAGGGNAGGSTASQWQPMPSGNNGTPLSMPRGAGDYSRMAEAVGNAGGRMPPPKPYWEQPGNEKVKAAASAANRPKLGESGYLEREDIKAWMNANRGKGMIGGKGPDIVDRMILQHQAKLPESAVTQGDAFSSGLTDEETLQTFTTTNPALSGMAERAAETFKPEQNAFNTPSGDEGMRAFQMTTADLGLGARVVSPAMARESAASQVAPMNFQQSAATSPQVANDMADFNWSNDPQMLLRGTLNRLQGVTTAENFSSR